MLTNDAKMAQMRKLTHPRRLGIPLGHWGRNLIANCPFHAPEEQSLFFYDALGYWRYRCLQCGSEGDLIEFVKRSRYNGLDDTAAEAEALEFWGGHDKELENEDSEEHDLWAKEVGGEKARVLELFVRYCHWAASKSESSAEFFGKRGWSIGQAQLYGLGYYSGDAEPFFDYCALAGMERHQVSFYLDNLEAFKEPRITIPARNAKGIIHAVYGRYIDNSNDDDLYISFASGNLDIPFNMQQDNENPIIVEGIFDALTADLAGISGVVSTLYQELGLSHLYKLKASGAVSLTVVLRREPSRRNQEKRIQKYLKMAETLNLRFKTLILPHGKTVDLLLREKGADFFMDMIRNTEEDTTHTHRRSVLLQDIRENFDIAMSCPPDVSVGYKLPSFPRLTEALDGIQSGCFFLSSQPYGLKGSALTSMALDLIEGNDNLKVIYINLESPRRQIFDRIISMMTGESILSVKKQSGNKETSNKVLNATKTLLRYVRENRLEIWEDYTTFDNVELFQILKDEVKEHQNILVILDGIDHLRISDRPDITDIHERRSSVMLDIYKALDIPIILGGELIYADNHLLGPRAYLRDSEAIFWIESKGGNIFLSIDSKRIGKEHVFEGNLIADPVSFRMKEE
jgi:hypothetical protein